MSQSVADRVIDVVSGLCFVSDDISHSSMLHRDLDLDSISAVGLVLSLEHEFDIEIPDDFLVGDMTVGQLIEKIELFELKPMIKRW